MITVNGTAVSLGSRYPDGTYSFRLNSPPAPAGDDYAQVVWSYDAESEAIALLYVVRHLQDHGLKDIHLFLPYLPNARMDRTENVCDVFTLKYFCGFINSIGFTQVTVFDPHSKVALALLNNVRAIWPGDEIDQILAVLGKDTLLFYPDEGAVKRYSKMVGLPYNFGVKHRDWESRLVTSYQIIGTEPIKGRRVLVVDDICSKGTTFERAAYALHDAGAAEIYLFCSHCEREVFKGTLLDNPYVTHLYTTNSIYSGDHPKISVFPIV